MRVRLDKKGVYLRNLSPFVKLEAAKVVEQQGGNVERILESVLMQIALEQKLGEYYLRAELTRIDEVREALNREEYEENK